MRALPSLIVAGAVFLAITCHTYAWETEADAAAQVRSLLASQDQHFGVGVLSTFNSSGSGANVPLQSHEYFAPCFDDGDLAFIALPVSPNWRNALASGANISFAVSSHPDPRISDPRHRSSGKRGSNRWDPRRPAWRRGLPSKLRSTLFGSVELLEMPSSLSSASTATSCFLKHHPDAKYWAPESTDSPHVARWARLRVAKIYAVGGFGDEHRIGWIDRQVYAQAGPHHAHHSGLRKLNDDAEDESIVPAASKPERLFVGMTTGSHLSTVNLRNGQYVVP